MKKGQNTESVIKNTLKFFKINENSISTVMGGVVILIIAALIFNYFRTTNLKTWQGLLLNEDKTATADKKEETKKDGTMATYKVKKGDDLWHISENFYKSGYNYVDIMKANKIKPDGVIVEGMELVIPDVPAKKVTVAENATSNEAKAEVAKTDGVKKEEPSKTVEKTSNDKQTIELGEYTTKHGDTYWNIALRAYGDGYAWVKIYEANKKIFGNPDMIHADVKINIPSIK